MRKMRLTSIGRTETRAWRGQASGPSVAFLKSFAAWIVSLALAGALLGACAAQLAPNFDRTIIDGLTNVNEDAMTLFASVSGGAPKSTFPRRKDSYDKVIGKLEAVRLQLNARPNPRPLSPQIFGVGPKTEVNLPPAPTPGILAAMASNITAMRDADSKFGLRVNDVAQFRSSFVNSMDQALTYEKALER
jgi:hypothetical protein